MLLLMMMMTTRLFQFVNDLNSHFNWFFFFSFSPLLLLFLLIRILLLFDGDEDEDICIKEGVKEEEICSPVDRGATRRAGK